MDAVGRFFEQGGENEYVINRFSRSYRTLGNIDLRSVRALQIFAVLLAENKIGRTFPFVFGGYTAFPPSSKMSALSSSSSFAGADEPAERAARFLSHREKKSLIA